VNTKTITLPDDDDNYDLFSSSNEEKVEKNILNQFDISVERALLWTRKFDFAIRTPCLKPGHHSS